MTWTKLGEEFPDEAGDLTSDAFRLHVEALAWSNRRLLDLIVPKRDLRRFTFVTDSTAAVDELVRQGWWQDCEGDWFIGMKFPEWQQEREQVEHRRAANRLSQNRKRKHDIGNHELCIPGRCKYLSSADARADSSTPSGSDPDRFGTERYGEPLTTKPSFEEGKFPDRRTDLVRANDEAMDRLRAVSS